MTQQDQEHSTSQKHQPLRKRRPYGRFAFEFLSIFIAVISAFALNNWNDDRRDRNAEQKILTEIQHGLEQDKLDIQLNIAGHEVGLAACDFWNKVIQNQPVSTDSISRKVIRLTRDFIAIQNRAGYESLKSKGLETIRDDSLRLDIISIYEYDFATLKTLEEAYDEMQFHRNYVSDFHSILGPYLLWDDQGEMVGLKTPLQLTAVEKSTLLLDLWKIRTNRNFILHYYGQVAEKIDDIINRIKDSH